MPDVVSVETLGPYRARLEFDDGVTGELDLESIISFEGVFAPLRDEREFSKARVDVGTITWPTGADLCPDVLYSKVTGKPIAE